jgi:hypothetical protein
MSRARAEARARLVTAALLGNSGGTASASASGSCSRPRSRAARSRARAQGLHDGRAGLFLPEMQRLHVCATAHVSSRSCLRRSWQLVSSPWLTPTEVDSAGLAVQVCTCARTYLYVCQKRLVGRLD